MKVLFFSLILFSIVGPSAFAQSDELPNGTLASSEAPMDAPKDPQLTCATPYANQIKALRNAQLRLTTPETGKTLADLKDEHDKRVAKLILLKGLKQVRSDYLATLAKQSQKLGDNVKSLDDLKKFTTDRQGEFKAIEKMLVLEKGIKHLTGISKTAPRSPDEFYAGLVASCANPPSSADRATKEASDNLCSALEKPTHKEMVIGFYNVYMKSEQSPTELKKYLSYLRMAAKETDLDEELNAAKNLQLVISSSSRHLQECSETQGTKCKLNSDLIKAAYSQYKTALEKEAVSSSSVVLSQSPISGNNPFELADQKIAEAKVFFEDIQTGDQKLVEPLESSALYEDIQKKLNNFSKKNKHSQKDYSELLKSMRCDGNLFSSDAAPQLNAFNSCIKNLTDSVLDQTVEDLNSEIEKYRSDIQTITSSPYWWESSTSKYTYNKYMDFSTVINEILAIMKKNCKLSNLSTERSYDLNACGVKDFLPPEEAQTLGHDVEKVLSGIQITAAKDVERIKDICSRLRDYGEVPPGALCDRGYDGRTPPMEVALEQKPSSNPGPGPAASAPSSSYDVSDAATKETRMKANSYRPSERNYVKSYPKFGAGDYAKAFASALSSSPAAMSTLGLWAQGPLFKSQLGWQVEMAKNQITAETYQQAWYTYYNKVQTDAWSSFLSGSNNLSLYNGGAFYNFTNQ